jgi:hypothetical protein
MPGGTDESFCAKPARHATVSQNGTEAMRYLPKTLIAAVFGLAGCGTVGSASLSGEGPNFVGRPAQDLFAAKGAPLRQISSPSGATIYVYEAHNLYGATFCEASFYVRDRIVVGFAARGPAPTCGGSAGRID